MRETTTYIFLLLVLILTFLGQGKAFATTFTVTKTADTADGTCDADCSLREAINAANLDNGTPHTINFTIDNADPGRDGNCVNATGVCTIGLTNANGPLPNLTKTVTIDGYSQSGAAVGTNNFPKAINSIIKIEIDGSATANGSDGITVNVANVVIKGLAIYGFPDAASTYGADGIKILNNVGNTGLKVQGCFIGVQADGETVSKNQGNGVSIIGANNTGTVIGTDGDGVSDAAERNVVSGNDNYGIWLSGPTTVAGNIIGADDSGSLSKGQRLNGIYCDDGVQTIGTNGNGTYDTGEGNLISGNVSHGIRVSTSGCDNTVIAGNYIGTNADGTGALGNTTQGILVKAGVHGVRIGTNSDGTSDTAERNVISGNTSSTATAIRLEGSDNKVMGNYLGLNVAGTGAIGNGENGVLLLASDNNVIGTDGDGVRDSVEINTIAGNTKNGIRVDNSDNNIIAGNKIGVGTDGTSLANNLHGVYILNGSINNTIGGDIAAEANQISNNGNAASEYGIYVAGAATDGNQFLRNTMTSNYDKGIRLNADGANNNQSSPTISSMAWNGLDMDISGTSIANGTVQIFDASTEVSPATVQEGETYLSQGTANGSGNWTITISPPYNARGNTLVATATDGSGTSEFSSVYTVPNTMPQGPTALGPTVLVNGSSTSDATPTLNFTLSDNDVSDTVKYQIQIDDSSDYSSAVIDYTSALAAQGAYSFTVGMAAGSGSYTSGAEGNVLQKGNWYWRVKAIDNSSASSSYTVANAGVAFVETAYTVNTTADDNGTCDTSCSLREAITTANGDAGTPHTINFSIDNADPGRNGNCVQATGVCTIGLANALGVLPTLTKTMTIDGYSQPGAVAGTNSFPKPLNAKLQIQIDGSSLAVANVGLQINVANTLIKGLSIYGFPDSPGLYRAHGIYVQNSAGVTGTKIQGCFIGVMADGVTVSKNQGNGIYISGTNNSGTIIGTNGDGVSDAEERNLIAGNDNDGINLAGASTVAGNIVGTDWGGSTDKGQRLVGIRCTSSIQTIGTNGDGTYDTGEGNLISGNDAHSIRLQGSGCDNSIIAGNYIGTNMDGTGAVGNGLQGVQIDAGLHTVRIGTNADGTSDAAERNVISGNSSGSSNGITLQGSNITVMGNYIGVNAVGTGSVANVQYGIFLSASDNNVIGTNGDGVNDAVEANVISGNSSDGINVDNSDNNVIAGNLIGVGSDGTPLENKRHGIYLLSGSINNTVGGDIAAEGNTISYNGNVLSEYGVYVAGASTDGNQILRNKMTSNEDKGIRLNADGANNNQALPTLSSDSCSGSNVVITGTSGANETIQLFDASTETAPATVQEGETYLTQGTADGGGSFSVTITDTNYTAVGNLLVANATNSSNGTSEFTGTYSIVSNCTRKRLILIH